MDINNSTTNNLLFLLAAAPMGMGCVIVSDDGDDTANDTGNVMTSGTSTTTETPTGGTTGDESTGGSSGASSTGVEPTGAEESTSAADSTGGDDVCADYGALYHECFPDYSAYDYAESYCNAAFEYGIPYSEECATAVVDQYACLNALPCEELPAGGGDGCAAELAAYLKVCPSVE